MAVAGEHELPERALRWVIDSVDPSAAVLEVRRLYGGMSSAVHRLLLQVGGQTADLVLRRFDNADWLRQEPDLSLHEAQSLRMAARTGLSVPQLAAFDPSGSECGLPAVLMSRLDGSVVLKPERQDRWLGGLAKALAQIHTVEADDFPWAYFTYHDLKAAEVPAWSALPGAWAVIVDAVKGPRPTGRHCFIHRDYHPTNVLWNGAEVSGVVDWVNACRGPAGVDVGHCRVNLASLYGVAAADAFLRAYLSFAGPDFRYEPYWDMVSLIDILFGPPAVYPGWVALGVTNLTDRLIAERLDEYAASLAERSRSGNRDGWA